MKPKVAFFDFSCCEGCQLQVVNLEEELLDVLGHIEVVNFREAISDDRWDFDIAFIEGSCTRESEVERLNKIRAQAKVVIALGSCAALGGINALKNFHDIEWVKGHVYGDKKDWKTFDTFPRAKRIRDVIQVEYEIPGCPIDREEFKRVFKDIVLGRKPRIPDYPVCVECKAKENKCRFEEGEMCLGPITRAGCDARCPSFSDGCDGCRGLITNPGINAYKEVLDQYKLTAEEIMSKFKLYGGCEEKLEGVIK